jgi:hypothetical protein
VKVAFDNVALQEALGERAGAVGAGIVCYEELAGDIEHGQDQPFRFHPEGAATVDIRDVAQFYPLRES